MKDETNDSSTAEVSNSEISTVEPAKQKHGGETESESAAAAIVEPPPPEQALFAKDGYLLFPSTLPEDTVKEWANKWATESFFENLFIQLHKLGHTPFPTHRHPTTGAYALGRGIQHGFREIVMRSPGRYEIAVAAADEVLPVLRTALPWIPSLFLQDPHATTTTTTTPQPSSCCWDDTTVRCVSTTLVIATPGAVDQPWHADGGHIHHDHHAPCHCLNVCIPLTSTHYSPTQVRPGSHYWTRHPHLATAILLATARKQVRPCVDTAASSVGEEEEEQQQLLVFDYRLLHRGRAHTITTSTSTYTALSPLRVVLLVTLSVPWFRDVVNFPRRSMYDAVAPPAAAVAANNNNK